MAFSLSTDVPRKGGQTLNIRQKASHHVARVAMRWGGQISQDAAYTAVRERGRGFQIDFEGPLKILPTLTR